MDRVRGEEGPFQPLPMVCIFAKNQPPENGGARMISLSIRETSSVLGVVPCTVRKWLKRGILEGFRLPGTAGWRIPLPSIIKLGVPPEMARRLAEMAQKESRRSRQGKGGVPPGERFSGSSGRKKPLSFLRSGG